MFALLSNIGKACARQISFIRCNCTIPGIRANLFCAHWSVPLQVNGQLVSRQQEVEALQQEVVREHSSAGKLKGSLTAQEAAMRKVHADLESKQDEIAAKHVQLVAAEGEAQCYRLQLLKEQAQLSALRQELSSLKVPAQTAGLRPALIAAAACDVECCSDRKRMLVA